MKIRVRVCAIVLLNYLFHAKKKHSDAYCRTLETGSLIFSEIILIANVNQLMKKHNTEPDITNQ